MAPSTPFWDDLPPQQSAAWEEDFEERAAIMEFHGGLSTAEAEVEAYRQLEAQYLAEKELIRMGKVGERVGTLPAEKPQPMSEDGGDEEAGDADEESS